MKPHVTGECIGDGETFETGRKCSKHKRQTCVCIITYSICSKWMKMLYSIYTDKHDRIAFALLFWLLLLFSHTSVVSTGNGAFSCGIYSKEMPFKYCVGVCLSVFSIAYLMLLWNSVINDSLMLAIVFAQRSAQPFHWIKWKLNRILCRIINTFVHFAQFRDTKWIVVPGCIRQSLWKLHFVTSM